MKYFVAMYYNAERVPIAQSLISACDLDEAKGFVDYKLEGAFSCGVVELTPTLLDTAGVAMFEHFTTKEVLKDEQDLLSIPLTTGGYLN